MESSSVGFQARGQCRRRSVFIDVSRCYFLFRTYIKESRDASTINASSGFFLVFCHFGIKKNYNLFVFSPKWTIRVSYLHFLFFIAIYTNSCDSVLFVSKQMPIAFAYFLNKVSFCVWSYELHTLLGLIITFLKVQFKAFCGDEKLLDICVISQMVIYCFFWKEAHLGLKSVRHFSDSQKCDSQRRSKWWFNWRIYYIIVTYANKYILYINK